MTDKVDSEMKNEEGLNDSKNDKVEEGSNKDETEEEQNPKDQESNFQQKNDDHGEEEEEEEEEENDEIKELETKNTEIVGHPPTLNYLPEIPPVSRVGMSMFKDITIESIVNQEVEQERLKVTKSMRRRTASEEALLNPSKQPTENIESDLQNLSINQTTDTDQATTTKTTRETDLNNNIVERTITTSEVVPIKKSYEDSLKDNLNSPFLKDDLIPPSDPCYRDLGLRDESVKLLHLLTCFEIFNFITSIIEDTQAALSINPKTNTDRDDIDESGRVESNGRSGVNDDDDDYEDEKNYSINQKLKSIVVSCVRRNVEDLCKNSRIQTQLMIAELLLNSTSIEHNSSSSLETNEKKNQSEVSTRVKLQINLKMKELLRNHNKRVKKDENLQSVDDDDDDDDYDDEVDVVQKEEEIDEKFKDKLLRSISIFGNIDFNSIPVPLFSSSS